MPMTREDEKREAAWRKKARASSHEHEMPNVCVNVGRIDCTICLWEVEVPGRPFWRVFLHDIVGSPYIENMEYWTAEDALTAARGFAKA